MATTITHTPSEEKAVYCKTCNDSGIIPAKQDGNTFYCSHQCTDCRMDELFYPEYLSEISHD